MLCSITDIIIKFCNMKIENDYPLEHYIEQESILSDNYF